MEMKQAKWNILQEIATYKKAVRINSYLGSNKKAIT